MVDTAQPPTAPALEVFHKAQSLATHPRANGEISTAKYDSANNTLTLGALHFDPSANKPGYTWGADFVLPGKSDQAKANKLAATFFNSAALPQGQPERFACVSDNPDKDGPKLKADFRMSGKGTEGPTYTLKLNDEVVETKGRDTKRMIQTAIDHCQLGKTVKFTP